MTEAYLDTFDGTAITRFVQWMTDSRRETHIMGKTEVELAKLTERVAALEAQAQAVPGATNLASYVRSEKLDALRAQIAALEAAEQARQPVVTPTGDPEPENASTAKKDDEDDDDEDEDTEDDEDAPTKRVKRAKKR